MTARYVIQTMTNSSATHDFRHQKTPKKLSNDITEILLEL
jgi:hypothetical protein